MVVVSGSGSPAFSGQNPQLLQQSNYFRRGSDRLQLGSNWVKPILDEKFAQNIISKVLPSLNARVKTKLRASDLTLKIAPNVVQFRNICRQYGYSEVSSSIPGISSPDGKVIILNPEVMAIDASLTALTAIGSEKANESCFILTLIHELTHMSGAGFDNVQLSFNGRLKTFDMSPINEGFTETFSRKLMKELYPKEFKSNRDKYYDEYISIAERMLGLADNGLLQAAFFGGPSSGKMQEYFNKISQLDSKNAAGLFSTISIIGKANKKDEIIDQKPVLNEISKHLSVLENARKIQLASQKSQQETAEMRAKERAELILGIRKMSSAMNSGIYQDPNIYVEKVFRHLEDRFFPGTALQAKAPKITVWNDNYRPVDSDVIAMAKRVSDGSQQFNLISPNPNLRAKLSIGIIEDYNGNGYAVDNSLLMSYLKSKELPALLFSFAYQGFNDKHVKVSENQDNLSGILCNSFHIHSSHEIGSELGVKDAVPEFVEIGR